MAHIHLEDGSFKLLWAAVWWIATLFIIAGCLFWLRSRKNPDMRIITIAAFCSAAIFAIFLVDIPVAGGIHLNMTPLAGILTGPLFGCLVVFVVNIMTASIGHGGWSMIGANTLVNVTEVVVAYTLFIMTEKMYRSLFVRAVSATFAGLVCGNIVMVAIILVSGIQGVLQGPDQILAGLSLVVAINLAAAAIEAVITGLMVAFITRIRPDILGGRHKNKT
jgi:cobalt/nickel transport system permease protein